MTDNSLEIASDLNTPQDFIDFYSKIPEELWCTHRLYDGAQCCALGHLGGSSYSADREMILSALFRIKLHACVENVNDGFSTKYDQKNPKARVLAALEDIKEGLNG